ncbi:MAG: cytochrome c3 family protein, partial [Deltaproteobacteria bacterium]
MKSLFFLILLLITSSYAFSDDVISAKAYQQGNRFVIEYDLGGNSPANLQFSIVVSGKSYPAERLHLEGDFGKGIRPGTGKKIIWNTLQDFPRGVRGEVRWSLNVEKKPGISSGGTSWFSNSEAGIINMKKGVIFRHKSHQVVISACKACHSNGSGKIEAFGKDWA